MGGDSAQVNRAPSLMARQLLGCVQWQKCCGVLRYFLKKRRGKHFLNNIKKDQTNTLASSLSHFVSAVSQCIKGLAIKMQRAVWIAKVATPRRGFGRYATDLPSDFFRNLNESRTDLFPPLPPSPSNILVSEWFHHFHVLSSFHSWVAASHW